MTTIADPPPASSRRHDIDTASMSVSARSRGIRALTPADIASWEAGLLERTELCLALARTRQGKLSIYAGPDARGGMPVAVLTGIGDDTYVSRPLNSDIEEWIASILRSALTLADSL